MKNLKFLPLMLILAITACGEKKKEALAAEAMEKALAAEAKTYAPQEYDKALNLFNQMNEAVDNGDQERSAELADKTVAAANEAIAVARQNKATQLIAQLKEKLALADQIGIDESNPNEFQQATQSLIDAESFYVEADYESAASSAQEGLSLLDAYLNSKESLALAKLNRARELHQRATQSTDTTQTKADLEDINRLIVQSANAYQNQDFETSISDSQEAIDRLEYLISQYPSKGNISVKVNLEDNIQVQSYDLIQRLNEVISFIKENNYNKPVNVDGTPVKEEMPATNTTPAQETEKTGMYMTNSSKPAPAPTTSMPLVEEPVYEETVVEEPVYVEEEYTNQMTNSSYIEEQPVQVEEELPLYYYEETSNALFSQLPVMMRAQSMNGDDVTVITVEVLEDYQRRAQEAYDAGNHLNAADIAREGLRLADLYLAGQSIAVHTVIKGDTLWDISGQYYKKDYFLWPNIWRANKLIIKDPDLIYPKQKFQIPPAPIKNKK